MKCAKYSKYIVIQNVLNYQGIQLKWLNVLKNS